MLIGTDGACKRNGEPTCTSIGAAWIQTESGELLFKSKFEHESTSQRGELNGLLEALEYATANATDEEDVIIITDSEYLYNSVTLGWSFRWEAQNWYGASGAVKNSDLWYKINACMRKLTGRLYMQWTKGHLIHYTPGNIKRAMQQDPTGVQLFMNISSVANRPMDHDRIIADFKHCRETHGHIAPPDEVCIEWAIANAMADALASYLVKTLDDILL